MADGSDNQTRPLAYIDRLQAVRWRTRSNFLTAFAEIVAGSDGDGYVRGVSALARRCGTDRKTMQRSLADMAAWGFITIEHEGQGYHAKVRITVTPAGWAFRAEALAVLFPEVARP